MKLSSMCWCGRSQVQIPVDWVSLGVTANCKYAGCGPGCEYADSADDETADDPYNEPIVIAAEQRSWKMSKFEPVGYDPADDSTPGMPRRRDAVTLLSGEGLCGCGCGESPASARTRFCMGHDARLKGALTRAHASGVAIALIDNASGETTVVPAMDYAARFSTNKTDWTELVRIGAEKVAARRGTDDRLEAQKELLRRASANGAIRIGKWGATGGAAAVYARPDGAPGHIVEYVDDAGRISQVEVDVA